MKAIEFVEYIRGKPIDPKLVNIQFSGRTAERIISNYKIGDKSSKYVEYGNEILNLIHNYDLSTFEVGEITFQSELFIAGDYVFFGWDDYGDRVCYYEFSKEVSTYYVAADQYQNKCADSDESFLDALFELYMLSLKRTNSLDRSNFKQFDEEYMSKIRSILDQQYWAYWQRFTTDDEWDEIFSNL